MTTSLNPISLYFSISLIFNLALELERPTSHGVPHNVVPAFSSGHPKQCQEGHAEVLEVGMDVKAVLKLNSSKEEDSKNRVHQKQ
jgi:hypothetical protein